MSSKPVEKHSAEDRFRQAFDRLKANAPRVVAVGSAVTQNNVAREAGCDPSALRRTRFPALIREIQAYVELHAHEPLERKQSLQSQRNARRSAAERLADAIKQRDTAQSMLGSANRRIVELTEQVTNLQHRLDELEPKPTVLGRR